MAVDQPLLARRGSPGNTRSTDRQGGCTAPGAFGVALGQPLLASRGSWGDTDSPDRQGGRTAPGTFGWRLANRSLPVAARPETHIAPTVREAAPLLPPPHERRRGTLPPLRSGLFSRAGWRSSWRALGWIAMPRSARFRSRFHVVRPSALFRSRFPMRAGTLRVTAMAWGSAGAVAAGRVRRSRTGRLRSRPRRTR